MWKNNKGSNWICVEQNSYISCKIYFPARQNSPISRVTQISFWEDKGSKGGVERCFSSIEIIKIPKCVQMSWPLPWKQTYKSQSFHSASKPWYVSEIAELCWIFSEEKDGRRLVSYPVSIVVRTQGRIFLPKLESHLWYWWLLLKSHKFKGKPSWKMERS